MKHSLIAVMALFAMLASTPGAHAVTCANGVYRAGCAGPNGAAAVRKPVATTGGAAVYHAPASAAAVHTTPAAAAGCAWVNGRRVCR